jgi:hypothetical protein
VIGHEIVDLIPMPQEQTIYSEKYGLALLRLDFKAIILTKNGKHEKILIEMQKAKNSADLFRFRRYLGENYSKPDKMGDVDVNLPITCIYFIGYEAPIQNAIVYNKLIFRDIITDKEIEENVELLELLNHKSYFIFIDNLPKVRKQNFIFEILDIFDQESIFDSTKKWILEKEELSTLTNPKYKQLLMRLHEATLEAELLEKARLEEEFNRDIEQMISKLEKEAYEERKLKEEAILLKEEAILLKEEAIVLKEEEKRLKEEAILLKEKEKRLKEEAILLKEKALNEIAELKKLLNQK